VNSNKVVVPKIVHDLEAEFVEENAYAIKDASMEGTNRTGR
jgi:hypothetical protein